MDDDDALHGYVIPPKTLKAFPSALKVKPKTPRKGGGLRPRSKDETSGYILEWDYQHGRLEIYDKRGKHLFECDAETAALTKGPDPTRSVEP